MPTVEAEWDRLRRAVWSLVQEAHAHNDPQELVAVLGMSLHEVQDFYAHTNWVEPPTDGFGGGPDWQSLGYGSNPTWFDLPKAAREEQVVYSANRAAGANTGSGTPTTTRTSTTG